jgi:hypothetical protein
VNLSIQWYLVMQGGGRKYRADKEKLNSEDAENAMAESQTKR